VDYSGSGATWACHENYSHCADSGRLRSNLIPHLVTRIIYTGAGGLNPLAGDLQFCLSPRVCHLTQVTSASSTCERGIYHSKDEPLARGGWRRLHILAGESLCSDFGIFLKAGATALVAALTEAGHLPGDAVRLRDPLGAMRAFNTDPTCRCTAETEAGEQLSALEIQRRYLECAERNLGHPVLPTWAESVCRTWRETLDALERDPGLLSRRLDWLIKRALFQQHIEARRFSWETIDLCNTVVRKVVQVEPGLPPSRLRQAGGLRGFSRALTEALEPLEVLLAAHGLSLDVIGAFARLRAELCELDLRFGRVGPEGLFAKLDRAGLLDHRVAGVEPRDIKAAAEEPPAGGRAGVRGRLIRQMVRERRACSCDWTGLWDETTGQTVDLSDPLIESAPPWTRSMGDETDPCGAVLARIRVQYDRGNYEQANLLLDHLTDRGPAFLRGHEPEFHMTWFWIQCRRGQLDTARAHLALRAPPGGPDMNHVAEQMAFHRFSGLVPMEGIWEWIERGDQLIAANAPMDPVDRVSFLAHKGRALICREQFQQARAVLEQAVAFWPPRTDGHPRLVARTRGDLADACRLLGDVETARTQLALAEDVQRAQSFHGDLADFTLLGRAKLEYERLEVRPWLVHAEAAQRRGGNPMGLTRTQLILSRLFPAAAETRSLKPEIERRSERVPALARCPLTHRILLYWDVWLSGGSTQPYTKDFFWGL
jgi:hypothetical protein